MPGWHAYERCKTTEKSLAVTSPRVGRIAILGGGVAGVTLAAELAGLQELEITLLEKEEHLGGLHKTVVIDGCAYDIGTFLFPQDHQYFRSFPEFSSGFAPIDYRPVSIRLSGALDAYPLTLAGYRRDYGLGEVILSGLDCLRCRLVHRRRETLPAYVKYYIGGRTYVRSGLKHYIERLYHTEDVNVDRLFAEQRLQRLQQHLSLDAIVARIAARLRRRHIQIGPRRIVRVRPPGGFQEFYGPLRDHLEGQGVRITAGCLIQRIQPSHSGFSITFHDHTEQFDRVLSTIPIPTLADYLALPLSARFEYMKLVSLFYRFHGNAGFEGQVLFNYSQEGWWKRVTRFSEYYGRHDGDEYFVVEVTARDPWDVTVDGLREDFERHVRTLGLFSGRLAYQGHTVTENAYPLFRVDEIRRLEEAKERIQSLGIDIVGRQGNFEYLSSWLTALKAKALAERVREEALR
jgi:protoporphyrinogen oxidase